MNWSDVTYKQYKQLQEIINIEDKELQIIKMAEILLGEQVTDLPIQEFNKEIKKISFVNSEVKESIPPKHICVNGRKYYTDCLLGRITTQQYIDYTNHLKSENIEGALSVFVIPEGHKYNDGYDMLEVLSDIEDLPITVVLSINFFFKRQFQESIRIFQNYSIKVLKKTNLSQEQKNIVLEKMNHLYNSVLSLMS